MKIAYIGAADGLAETLVERMQQEGNDVYFISDRALPRDTKEGASAHFYQVPHNEESYEQLVRSLAPDCVIFAGYNYEGEANRQADSDVMLLARTLRAVAALPHVKFILLSSTDVYGNTNGKAPESAPGSGTSERAIRFAREEDLLNLYHERYGLDTVILRVSQLYTSKPHEGGRDLLSRSLRAAAAQANPLVSGTYQPLHVSDLTDAVKRVIDGSGHRIYNVTGNTEMSAERLHQLALQQVGAPAYKVQWDAPAQVALADSSRIRQELGWRAFRDLDRQLQEQGTITFESDAAGKQEGGRRALSKKARQLITNLVLFAVFFGLCAASWSSVPFSQIDWLTIYVVVVAVFCDVAQSALAAVLAAAVYTYLQQASLNGMSYSVHAGSALAVAEFLFLGLLISYATSALRDKVRSAQLDVELARREYEELSVINDENVLIKNEYRERLLTSGNGLPKLYSLVRRLMTQDPDRILMEVLQVVPELIRTETVAVYQGEARSQWLRLVGSLGDGSAMDGSTWNLVKSPRIFEAVAHGDVYWGEPGSGEPAVVLPVLVGNTQIVILIRKLPFESNTLYNENLLRTLSTLLQDAMAKAIEHQELLRDAHYIEGTNVLKPEAFHERVRLAQEKADRGLADFCVIELTGPGSFEMNARAVDNTIRATDYLGTDDAGRLLALLNNTTPSNLEPLQRRLDSYGITARLMPSRPDGLSPQGELDS